MTRPNAYSAHAMFVAPARAKPESWRLGFVIAGVACAFIASPTLIVLLAPSDAAAAAFERATTPLATLLQFLSFGITLAAIAILVRRFHQRGLRSLLGLNPAFLPNLKRSVIAVAIVLAVQEPLFLWLDRNFVSETRNIGQWALWVVPAMIALLVQVSTEEVFFRGYLQQQLATWSPSRWVWMVVPSVLFGLAHLPNATDPVTGFIWFFWATMLGAACADLTARTGNLGAAIGLHLANNLFALLIIGVQDAPTSGLALFLYAPADTTTFDTSLWALIEPGTILQLMLSALAIFVMWMAARLTLRV